MVSRASTERVVVATEGDTSLLELVAPWVREAVTSSDLGLPSTESTCDTFAASAALKARAAARSSGLPAFAGESGLVVHALGGAPGVWSSRLARSGRMFERSLAKIHEAVGGAREGDDPTAALVFAVALAWPDGYSEAIEARLDGHVLRTPKDSRRGWESVFVPMGHAAPLDELDPELRRDLDPRARVVRRLADNWLRGAA